MNTSRNTAGLIVSGIVVAIFLLWLAAKIVVVPSHIRCHTVGKYSNYGTVYTIRQVCNN